MLIGGLKDMCFFNYNSNYFRKRCFHLIAVLVISQFKPQSMHSIDCLEGQCDEDHKSKDMEPIVQTNFETFRDNELSFILNYSNF